MKKGEVIKFGKYYKINNMTKEPVEWIILDEDEKAYLVFSKYVIDEKRIDDSFNRGITWKTSEIRKWMNSELYDSLFTNEEKKFIIERNQSTSDNLKPLKMKLPDGYTSLFSSNENGVKGCKDSQDKLFLLSWEDAKKYFYDDDSNYQRKLIYNNLMMNFEHQNIDDVILAKESIKAIPTNYAKSKISNYTESEGADFWLRSPGMTCHAFVYSYNGLVSRMGLEQEEVSGVRPAIWISKEYINKIEQVSWKNKGLCQHCGGEFKGFFTKKCVACGLKKDY